MKFVAWKSLIITSLICLLPILFGVLFWNQLPEMVAVHFGINNQPDNFAPRWFAVFGIPFIMMMFQIISCIITDFNSAKHGRAVKFERVTKGIIPTMSVFLQSAIILFALGVNLDMRKVAMVIVSLMFITLGNYLPKLNYIKNYNIDTKTARKLNRVMGFGMVVLGILGFITVFMPPVSSVIWLLLLIPCIVASVIYGMKNGLKKRD